MKIEPQTLANRALEGARTAQGHLEGLLGPLGGLLGVSWRPLGLSRRPTWAQVGFQNGANMAKKTMPKPIQKSIPFKIDFWKDFGGFLKGKWRQVGTQIDYKSMPRCFPMLASFLDRFLMDFYSQLGPPNLEKSSPHCRESLIF